jgi:uncharacterized protein YjbJ (UPF0337 family)
MGSRGTPPARPVPGRRKKENIMGVVDKAKNAAQDAKGKAKEAAGKSTDNDRLETEGKADQSKADVKNAGEKVKDAFKH